MKIMFREILLEALGTLCNANVTFLTPQPHAAFTYLRGGAARHQQQLFIEQFIPTVLDAEETSEVSWLNFSHIRAVLQRQDLSGGCPEWQNTPVYKRAENPVTIDEKEFFDPQFDCDFTSLKDTETYYRGGEVYERPCGWYRFGLKVLNKYSDNKWLGTRYCSTQPVPGEWPVSYHGTSQKGAEGIIKGFYKAGPGQFFGRGIYSTPYINEAMPYVKTFTSKKNGKQYKVILQNRINPEFREKHMNDKYWLVPIPQGKTEQEEQEMVKRAIRPYGLMWKEV